MTAATLRRPFVSLTLPNYRRYFWGQVVSISGNWCQIVAETWLVLHLTGSGTAVGVTAGFQFLPILLGGAYGGLLADRFPKRKLLAVTQTLMIVPPLLLFGLTSTGVVEVWMVWLLVLARGSILAVDNPTRQAFVSEIVGDDRVVNAVSLNSVIVHGGRIVGPALAALLIATAGVADCFLVNSASFVVMIVMLRRMDPAALRPARAATRARGQLRETLAIVWERPELRTPLLLMALIGTLSFNFQVLLPLLARFEFHGNAATYAALTIAMGIGAIAGALALGTRRAIGLRMISLCALAFGVLSLAVASAPTLPLAMLALVPTGAASVAFAAAVNSSLQLAAPPAMRGRVMALYAVVFLGSTPIGGPLSGWLSSAYGPRAGLVLGGVAAIVGAILARRALQRATVDACPSPGATPTTQSSAVT